MNPGQRYTHDGMANKYMPTPRRPLYYYYYNNKYIRMCTND